MATVETAQQQAQTQAHDRPDRTGKRRPFSTWMKKLASFKGGSTAADPTQSGATKRNTYQMKSHSKKLSASKNNNPYPESGNLSGSAAPVNGLRSFSTVPTGNESSSSLSRSGRSMRSSEDGLPPPTIGNKSIAATVSTEHDATHSDVAPSHAASSGDATAGTVGVNSTRGQDSTFSSPAPSVRSLTTTLTTIHSATATPVMNTQNGIHGSSNGNNTQTIHFTHQFPSSPPPSALPPHLIPQGSSGGHPATYSTATANNLLTDNASILTLASSSKRRRRRSMDTDASVRALAPSSLFGGSRESLPLSVLSSNIESNPTIGTPGLHQNRQVGPTERASIYSATGVTPALPSERNSYYAGKQSTAGDGGSVKSGMVGHGRNDSVSGSIGGITSSGSPLASPREPPGRISRNNSGWGEMPESPNNDTQTVDEEKADENAENKAEEIEKA